jgi:PDDEXK-like domain of unknown function (DUF3799)
MYISPNRGASAESIKPGFYQNISSTDYHNGPGISNTGLTLLARSPLHYWSEYIDPNRTTRKETPALRLGTAIHCALLEPDRFESDYVRQPKPEDFPEALVDANDYKEACKKFGCPVSGTKPELRKRLESAGASVEFFEDIEAKITAGKLVLSLEESRTCHQISESVRSHPTAKSLFASGVRESSIYWTDAETGVLCRCRPDWWNMDGDIVTDIKSTIDASPDGFQRTMVSHRYWVNAAFYWDGIHAAGYSLNDYVFAAWEKKRPYACAFYYVTGDVLEAGRQEYKRLLKIYKQCQDTGQWPGYGDMLKPLTLPPWFGKRDTMQSLEFREEEDWLGDLLQ